MFDYENKLIEFNKIVNNNIESHLFQKVYSFTTENIFECFG